MNVFVVLTIGASIAYRMGGLSRKYETAYESVIEKGEKIID